MRRPPTVLAIVPLCFANRHERTFFADRPELIGTFLRQVLAVPALARIVLAAEEGLPLPVEASDRIRVLRLPPKDRERTPNAPFDTPELAAVLADPDTSGYDHILYLDIRQPGLTTADLTAALDRYFQEMPPVMLSVAPTHDHPCQVLHHARILEQGFLHLFEAPGATVPGAPSGLPHRVTRPVPVNWSTLPTGMRVGKHAKQLWAVASCADTMAARPVTMEQAATEPILLLQTAPDRIRMFVHPTRLPASDQTVAGIFHSDLARSGRARPVLSQPDGRLEIDCGAHAEATLLFLSVCDASGRAGEVSRHVTRPGDGRIILDANAREASGLLFSRLLVRQDGPFDMTFPFRPEEALWGWNTSGVLVENATGKELLGRQDLPPILVREPGLALFPRAASSEACLASLAQGRALGWIIDTPSLDIRSPRDAALADCRLMAGRVPASVPPKTSCAPTEP